MLKTNLNNNNEIKYVIFYDDKCPLCIRTIKFLKKFVNPLSTKYQSISNSDLSLELKNKALNDMLLVMPDNSYLWGYKTYRKIFSLSSSGSRFLFKFLSFIMEYRIISYIGNYVYNFVSSRRKRCDQSCEIDTNIK